MDTRSKFEAEAIRRNFTLQRGMYFDQSVDSGESVLYLSDYIDDCYWNYAANLDASAVGTEHLIGTVESEMTHRDRQPALYVLPTTPQREELLAEAQRRSYECQFKDAWMYLEGDPGEVQDPPSNLKIEIVRNQQQRKDFLELFRLVNGADPQEDDPYGGLPEAYFSALGQSLPGREPVNTFHLIGYVEDSPVSQATLVTDGSDYGGIYNVGTRHDHRQKGYGTALSLACVDRALSLPLAGELFLQTEAGSKVESFYQSMGFVTRFVAECWSVGELP